MGKRVPIRPSWTDSLATMIADYGDGQVVQVRCRKCGACRNFTRADLEALAAAKGPAFSLVNRRTRCRLTPGCSGWNVFSYQRGPWMYGLFDLEQETIWMERDAAAATSKK